MTELTASRTLVKSPPELWAECSDAASLGRHLDRFGDIRITRLEPETVVAWEGESACGTVRLEPSGWGTKVVLTAQPALEPDLPAPVAKEPGFGEPEPEAVAVQEPAEVAVPEPVAVAEERPRRGAMGWLLGLFWRRPAPAAPGIATELEPWAEPESETESEPECEPESGTPAPIVLELMALEQALDSLGQAHHRPFSRG